VPPNATAQGWEVGFMPEARGTRPPYGQPGATQLNQSMIPPEYRPQVTSTPAVGRGTRQMLKLQRYDGTENLDTFLRKFHSMLRYLQWNEDDTMYHLCGSLEGAAGQVLLDIGRDDGGRHQAPADQIRYRTTSRTIQSGVGCATTTSRRDTPEPVSGHQQISQSLLRIHLRKPS